MSVAERCPEPVGLAFRAVAFRAGLACRGCAFRGVVRALAQPIPVAICTRLSNPRRVPQRLRGPALAALDQRTRVLAVMSLGLKRM